MSLFPLFFCMFCIGYLLGVSHRRLGLKQNPPIIAGQTWFVPGRGKVKVEGTFVDFPGFEYVVLSGVNQSYWPSVRSWHRSGASLVDDNATEILKAISEVNDK